MKNNLIRLLQSDDTYVYISGITHRLYWEKGSRIWKVINLAGSNFKIVYAGTDFDVALEIFEKAETK